MKCLLAIFCLISSSAFASDHSETMTYYTSYSISMYKDGKQLGHQSVNWAKKTIALECRSTNHGNSCSSDISKIEMTMADYPIKFKLHVTKSGDQGFCTEDYSGMAYHTTMDFELHNPQDSQDSYRPFVLGSSDSMICENKIPAILSFKGNGVLPDGTTYRFYMSILKPVFSVDLK